MGRGAAAYWGIEKEDRLRGGLMRPCSKRAVRVLLDTGG